MLGHLIDEGGIRPDPAKTECIKNYPEPKNHDQALSFISLCSYFRKYIYNFANIAKPIYQQTRKGEKFDWNSDCQESFEIFEYSWKTFSIGQKIQK